jgi:hypothetical protein
MQRLLDIIPQMQHLNTLYVNLDFTSESVWSSLYRNSSILYLYSGEDGDIITTDAAANLLERNGRLLKADELLDSEFQGTTPLDGVWAKAIERLTIDDSGTTAVNNILREKLVVWCAALHSDLVTAAALPSVPSPIRSQHDAAFPSVSTRANPSATKGGDDVEASSTSSSTTPTSACTTTSSDSKRSYTLLQQASSIGDNNDHVEKSATTSTRDDDDEPRRPKRSRRGSSDNSTGATPFKDT